MNFEYDGQNDFQTMHGMQNNVRTQLIRDVALQHGYSQIIDYLMSVPGQVESHTALSLTALEMLRVKNPEAAQRITQTMVEFGITQAVLRNNAEAGAPDERIKIQKIPGPNDTRRLARAVLGKRVR